MSKLKVMLSVAAMSFVMIGCGGGSSDGGGTPSAPPLQQGGTASTPAEIMLDMDNELVTNNFNNYFKYTGKEGEKLVIHVELDEKLTGSAGGLCGAAGDSWAAVYDTDLNYISGMGCNLDFIVIFPTDTTYIIHFDYYAHSGYFNAASILP